MNQATPAHGRAQTGSAASGGARPARGAVILVSLLTLGALILRIYLLRYQLSASLGGLEYLWTAKALLGDPAGDALRPIGYALPIALVHLPGVDWIAAARVVSVLAGTALVPLLWLLSRRLVADNWTAWVPAVLATFLPLAVRSSVITEAEALAASLAVAAAWTALGGRAVLAGVLAGLSVLTVPAQLLAVALFPLLASRRSRVPMVASLAGVLLVGLVLNTVIGGVSLPNQVSVTTASWDERDVDDTVLAARGEVERRFANRTGPLADGAVGRYLDLFGAIWDQVGYGVLLLVIPFAMAGGGWILAGLAPALLYPWFHVGEELRFAVLLLPWLWLGVAAGLHRLPRMPAVGVAALLVALAGVTAWREVELYDGTETGYFPELVEAGEWLKERVPAGSVIGDVKGYAAFHAGGIRGDLPWGPDGDAVWDEVAGTNLDFVVLHQGSVRGLRPELLAWAEDKPIVWHETRGRVVHVDTRYLDGHTTVFRVVRPGGPSALAEERSVKTLVGELAHTRAHYHHGTAAMRAENWFAAAGEFATETKRNPENHRAYHYRALCLLRAGRDLERADTDARRAVQLQPENAEYVDTLIRILDALGRPAAADLWRDKARELAGEPVGDGGTR